MLGILLGKDEGIEQGIKENFAKASFSHILAVSGLHVVCVITILGFLLSKGKIGRRKIKVITLLVLAFFVLLTNHTPSVRRACMMAGFGILATLVERKSDTINNIAISLLIILIQNPFSLMNTGLILSYSAVLGITLMSPIFLKENQNKTIWNEKIKPIIVISSLVQIAILPISIVLFQRFSITFIFSNLLVSFFMGILMMLGFFISIPIQIPILSDIIIFILDKLFTFLLKISEVFASFPLSNLLVCTPKASIIIIYYIGLLFWVYWKTLKQKENKRRFEKQLLTNVDKFKKVFFKRKGQVMVVIAIVLLVYKIITIPSQDLQISMLDVGQGDCIFITTPNHRRILIDGGGNQENEKYDIGKKVLIPYLLSHHTKEIDTIVISHFDSDHVRGIAYCYEGIICKKCDNRETI